MVNIIEPYAHLVGVGDPTSIFTREDGINCLRRIEYFGRVSHRSEDAQTDSSWERFIRTVVLGHGDFSIIEHASVTVDMVVDRGITHELVRHRLLSFTQESTRFVNYEKKMPPKFILPLQLSELHIGDWHIAVGHCEEIYKRMISEGETPQIARSVLPNALANHSFIDFFTVTNSNVPVANMKLGKL